MTKVENIFSLIMTQAPKVTSYTIQTMERSLVEMSSLMKKYEIGVFKKTNMRQI